MISLTVAARRVLVTSSSLISLLGSDGVFGPWIFRQRPGLPLENTERAALVLHQRSQWTSPSLVQTLSFPRLEVEVFVDPWREADNAGPVSTADAESRLLEIVTEMNKLLHVVDGSPWWDEKLIVSSKRSNEPEPRLVAQGNGLVHASVMYNVCVAS